MWIDRLLNFLKPLTVILGVLTVVMVAQQQFPSGAGLPSGLAYVAPTLTVSTSGGGNAVVALSGNTSGTATFTAPAVAGTRTNGVTMTNALLGPVGSATNPTYSFTGFAGEGISGAGGALTLTSTVNQLNFTINGTTLTQFFSGTESRMGSGGIAGFSSAADLSAAQDTSLTRSAAGVLAIGGGTAGSTTAKVKASGYMSVGTAFSTNAGCGESAPSDGSTAGRIVTVGSTSCTTIVTMGDSASAPHGWDCNVHDITTAADYNNPSVLTSNATTATIVTGTIVSGDTLRLSCIGF
jgi:hypothetical protein